jgi:hypothetical protein
MAGGAEFEPVVPFQKGDCARAVWRKLGQIKHYCEGSPFSPVHFRAACSKFGPELTHSCICRSGESKPADWMAGGAEFEPVVPFQKGDCARAVWRKLGQIKHYCERSPFSPVHFRAACSKFGPELTHFCICRSGESKPADWMAEGVGFEPTRPFWGLTVFKTAGFNRSPTPPRFL